MAKTTSHQMNRKNNRKKKSKPLAVMHSDYLSLLGKTKNRKKRTQLIDYGNREQIDAVKECAHNVLEGSVPVTKNDIQRLKKHKTALRNFASPRLPLYQKKAILKQSGGFLNLLLPIAMSALGSLGNLFTK